MVSFTVCGFYLSENKNTSIMLPTDTTKVLTFVACKEVSGCASSVGHG